MSPKVEKHHVPGTRLGPDGSPIEVMDVQRSLPDYPEVSPITMSAEASHLGGAVVAWTLLQWRAHQAGKHHAHSPEESS